MAVNKIIYGGNTILDLTEDTVTSETLLKGIIAHDKAGNIITGTYESGEIKLEEFAGYSGLYNKIELDDNKIVVDTTSGIFVATTGSDKNAGTYSAPYKTLSKALQNISAGKTIYVRAGTYNETITMNISGTAGNPITIRNYPNEIVTLNASGLNKEAIIDINGKSYINIIGLNCTSITQRTDTVYGVLFRGGEKHCIVANCEITNINGKSAAEGQANGIKLFGLSTNPIEYILIQNNHIHDCICGWSEALTVTSNSQYIDVIGNEIHDNGNIGIDIAGNFGDFGTPNLDHARYVYVAYNNVYNCNSGNADCAGIYSDGSSYTIFNSNIVHDCQIGMAIGSEMVALESNLPHNNIAINNLIYNNSVREIEIGATTANSKVYDTYILNNTIVHSGAGRDCTFKMNLLNGLYTYNNIIIDKGTWNYFVGSDYNETYISNFKFYNNLMYQLNGEGIGAYFNIAGKTYTTQTFLNASFSKDNIITSNYKLNEDYSLAENSPAIDKGFNINDILSSYPNLINYDLDKKKRICGNIDIGAKELQSSSLNLQSKAIEITENTTTEVTFDEGFDGLNKVTVTTNVQGGGKEPEFTGHYDVEGLKAIGWTDEDIQYYQDNGVVWNEEYDDIFKLDEEERTGQQDISITRFLPQNTSASSFINNNFLMALPKIDTSSRRNFNSMFENCRALITIPEINTNSATDMYRTFYNCSSLKTMPELNTSNVGDMRYIFYQCFALTSIPKLNMGKVRDLEAAFSRCYSIKTIPEINTDSLLYMSSVFAYCYSLTTLPKFDTSKVQYMDNAFRNCYALKKIPNFNTSSVKNTQYMFAYCYSLKELPKLNFSKVNDVSNLVTGSTSIMYLGGFENLGASYSTSSYSGVSSYTLDLTGCILLTHDSLINVINNLYDIKSAGCNAQFLKLGSTNLAKLTAEEIAVATAKGWTVS